MINLASFYQERPLSQAMVFFILGVGIVCDRISTYSSEDL